MIIKVIPNYAKNIKKEFIFIIDINKKCKNLLKKIDEENVFNSPQSKKLIIYFNKFLIFQELGHFKDISNYYFENEDVNFIVYLERKLEENMDLAAVTAFSTPFLAAFFIVCPNIFLPTDLKTSVIPSP